MQVLHNKRVQSYDNIALKKKEANLFFHAEIIYNHLYLFKFANVSIQ